MLAHPQGASSPAGYRDAPRRCMAFRLRRPGKVRGLFRSFSFRHTRPVSRTSITRLSRKASSERDALDRLLDTVHIGHFAFVADDHPVVLPTAVVRDGDRVLAHGSTGSGWLRRLAAGAPACLAVTAFDALVVARSAFEFSLRYRSAVLFGQYRPVP